MTEENYRKALQDAMHEADDLIASKSEIDKRLSQLKTTITALVGLLQQTPQADEASAEIGDLGISEAIRQVLKDAGFGLTPLEVKARLTTSGVDLSRYANAGAVIHNTLKRLEAQGEVVPVRNASNMATYALAPPAWGEGLDNLKALQRIGEESQQAKLERFRELARKIAPRSKSEGGSK